MRKFAATFLVTVSIVCSVLSATIIYNIQRSWAERVAVTIPPRTEQELSILSVLYPESKWAAFQQIESQRIYGDGGGYQKADVSALMFHGDPDSIVFFPMTAGRIPSDGENSVCALDRETAFELFRSVDVIGNWIIYDRKMIQVVGILDINIPLVVISGDSETLYTNIAACNHDELTTLVAVLGEEADQFTLSGMEVARLLWILCSIPWVSVVLSVVWRIRKNSGGWKVLSNVLLCIILMGLLIALLNCIPVRLLPARWSDLSFYSEMINNFRNRPYSMPTVRNVMLNKSILYTCIWCVVAYVSLQVKRKFACDI